MICDKTVSVIIPALNEGRAIGRVITDLPECVDEVIVVDNGSTDDTAEVAAKAGARVVKEERRGYGAACMAGIAIASQSDLIAFIDGDYSDYPGELAAVMEPVARDEVDLCIGSRPGAVDGRAVMPWHQRLGNWFLCRVVGVVHGYCYDDFGPMRCISRSVLEDLDMQDRNYGWTAEMQLKACGMGARVEQVQVGYRHRIGESKISGTVKGSIFAGTKILFWIVKLAVNPVPQKS